MSKPSYGFYLLHQMLLLPIIYYIVIDKIGIKSIPPPQAQHQKEGFRKEALFLVPVTRLELVRSGEQGILSPWCLPFHHTGRCNLLYHG